MRASTLFALTIAILIGLVVAITARVSGFFNAPAVEPAPKAKEIQVLVASTNLFAGNLINGNGVRVRALKPEEVEHYQKHKEMYVAATPQAIALRAPLTNIKAETPILEDMLMPMTMPESISMRLSPQMRAVQAVLPKERCAGGQIQTGEWVDVLLTTIVEVPGAKKQTVTACIAPKVKVIAKRDTLWSVLMPLPKGEPVPFTLEMNPYRAALVEFSKQKGMLTIIPLPASEQRKLDKNRNSMLQNASLKPIDQYVVPVHFVQPGTQEAEEEDARVNAYVQGKSGVNDTDLIRIFNIKLPETPPPPEPRVTVQRMYGVKLYSDAVFMKSTGLPAERVSQTSHPAVGAAGINFSSPDCPTCNQRREKAEANRIQQQR